MANSKLKPQPSKNVGTKAVFFDLDGTLCDVRWRLRVLEKKLPGSWDLFNSLCVYDDGHDMVIRQLKFLEEQGVAIFIFTGRNEKFRSQTEEWLRKRGIRYVRLIMRPEKHFAPSPALKLGMIRSVKKDFGLKVDEIFAYDDGAFTLEHLAKNGYRCTHPGNILN